MNAIDLPSNRHPVDQLGQIRETIKHLQDREKELREQISTDMGDADSLGGDEFIAKQSVSSRKGAIDTKAMEAAGLDPDRFRKPETTVFTIRTERRVVEEA